MWNAQVSEELIANIAVEEVSLSLCMVALCLCVHVSETNIDKFLGFMVVNFYHCQAQVESLMVVNS